MEELESSKIANLAFEIKNIDATMALGYNLNGLKIYSGDSGPLVSKMFFDKRHLDNRLYKSLILDELSADEGFLYESAVAQELRANGHALKCSDFCAEGSSNKRSIDFLLEERGQIVPVEAKPSSYKSHACLDAFAKKYHQCVSKKVVIYSKNYREESGCVYLPVYRRCAYRQAHGQSVCWPRSKSMRQDLFCQTRILAGTIK